MGCGKVPFFEYYKNYVSTVTCVDWPNSFHTNEFLDIECDINSNLPIESYKFDTIILSDVLEHIFNPNILWKEMNRILKIDGIILLNVPFYYKIHEQPHDYYRYTEYALKRFAKEENFKILFFKSFGGVPAILSDIFAKLFYYIPIIGKYLSSGVQIIAKFFISTQLGKYISEKTASSFPYGYFMVVQKYSD